MCLCSLMIWAADFTVDEICYNITSTNPLTVEVTSGGSYSGDIVIPDKVEYDEKKYSVTSIGQEAFHYCSGLTSITIPNSVTSIEYFAFSGCSGLISVSFGKSVTSIKMDAFERCTGLTKVIVNDIAAWCNIAFSGFSANPLYYAHHLYSDENTEITDLVIPNSVTSIGECAFYNCSSLTSVTIPNSVTSIGGEAFKGCSVLTSITIPNSVTTIGRGAFYGCRGLTSVTIPNGVTSIEVATFQGCSGLTSVTIPNSVTSIGALAFGFCRGLTSVIIPSSLTNISDRVFSGCSGLTSVTIPNSVTSIGDEAFEGCSVLTSITIPNSVTSIGWSAFKDCSSLTSVTIPNSVTRIENEVFSGCSGLTEVISMIEEPFAINSNCWYHVNTAKIPLYVPAGTKEKYQSTEGWKVFKNINEVSTGITINEETFSDNNFRNWVLAQGYGKDGVLTDDEIASVTEINVDGKNIASLKGIEYFTALKELDCSENKLTTLDVSKNTALTVLYCNDNQLTSLNVSGCTALKWLYCQYNNLTALDVSKNTALKELYCHGNLLTALNVSGCKALTRLECEVNKLTTLNVSGCTALVWLDCGGNNLTSLNVSKNTALEWLACDYNQLASLDVSKNTALTGLYCSANKIKGTEMDALIAGLQEKGGSFYAISPDFDNEQNVVTKAQVATAKKKRWTTYYYSDESEHWFEYEGSNDQTISPVNEGETIDIGSEIDANTNLNGNVVGDVYYNISSGNGSYNTAEGCIIVTKPTDDSAIDGQDIFGEDFKDNYTGIVFIVPAGNGTIKVEAQTSGNLVLKVKIGDNAPREMVLNDKQKASFPYNVSEDTFVYIYAGAKAAGAKGMRKASGNGELKIYGIEIVSGTDSLDNLTISQLDDSPVYNLNGQKVDGMPTNKGIYIKDGKKVLVK